MEVYVLMVLPIAARLTCSGWCDFAFNIIPLFADFVCHPVSTVPDSFTLTFVLRNGRNPSSPGNSISNRIDGSCELSLSWIFIASSGPLAGVIQSSIYR